MLSFMTRATLDILLLRRGPQDLPARREVLYVVILAYLVLSAPAYVAVIQMQVHVALMQSVSSLAYLAGFAWAVLALGGRRERFQQSFMALVATAAVFNILEVGPLISLMPYFLQIQDLMLQAQGQPDALDPAVVEAIDVPGFALVMLLLVYVWRLMVMAHVFHHALEISRGRAMAIALLFPGLIMFLALMVR